MKDFNSLTVTGTKESLIILSFNLICQENDSTKSFDYNTKLLGGQTELEIDVTVITNKIYQLEHISEVRVEAFFVEVSDELFQRRLVQFDLNSACLT